MEIRTPKELAQFAHTLALSQHLVQYHNVTYIPADYETYDVSVPPDPDRTIWLPLDRTGMREIANRQYDIVFRSDQDMASFEYMISQIAPTWPFDVQSLLVRTHEGLRELNEHGELTEVSGDFRANAVLPMLNTREHDKAEVFAVISGWLDSDKEAESLLTHLATCLSPGWSVVRYVLLLGEGRNGKSLMLRMVESLFGPANVSRVTRQLMSKQSPAVLDLNGKLANIVYDGQAEYVKDSGTEKSLIAGESVGIRRLFASSLTEVRTHALFIEGLNREPKTSDKSLALQKRLVRFQFPNVYELNRTFEKRMLSERMLGAFLSLLVDRYVPEDDLAWRLAPTLKSIQLQMEAMHVNSQALQFLQYLEQKTPGAGSSIVTRWFDEVAEDFRSWRKGKNDYNDWPDTEVLNQFKPFITTKRKSVRTAAGPRPRRIITSLTSETTEFLETLEGGETDDDADLINTLVDDGDLPADGGDTSSAEGVGPGGPEGDSPGEGLA